MPNEIMGTAAAQIGWMGPVTKTRDERIVIVRQGQHIWRTAVVDDGGAWSITGPPYPTKLEALSVITDVIAMWYS